MNLTMREYRRELALYVVAHAKEPMTAGEVAEVMGSTAMAEGHPQACWDGLDGNAALGYLRALENAGLVKQTGETKRDSRSGRQPPTWCYAPARARTVQLPEAPRRMLDRDDPPAVPSPASAARDEASSPYAGMSRKQLLTVLEVSDLYTTACYQFLQQITVLNGKARTMLAEVGLGPSGDPA